jgi:ubiquinone/menaquinone biosynthesis C-methylase UbiE
MIGETRGSRVGPVAAVAATFLGISLLLAARSGTAQAPAPSQPGKDAGSRGEEKPEATKNKPKSKAKANRSSKVRARRDEPGFYMGRPIAPVMTWTEIPWLFRDNRIQQEQPEMMLDALKIPRGATIADVGAGAGYHTIPLARRVGPKGTIYATDVQPEMLRTLREYARTAGVTNIKTVRCTQADPGLPEEAIDLILMVDVYHECSDPEATLRGLLKALKPRGRLVLVEFRANDPTVEIRPEHTMTLEQVRREVEPQGFAFKESLEFLPWQRMIFFEKPAARETKADESARPNPAERRAILPKAGSER